jgi:hypothetical protein
MISGEEHFHDDRRRRLDKDRVRQLPEIPDAHGTFNSRGRYERLQDAIAFTEADQKVQLFHRPCPIVVSSWRIANRLRAAEAIVGMTAFLRDHVRLHEGPIERGRQNAIKTGGKEYGRHVLVISEQTRRFRDAPLQAMKTSDGWTSRSSMMFSSLEGNRMEDSDFVQFVT